MENHFTLEYWQDEGWYVGRLKEIPGVSSRGESLTDLEENIKDAYKLVIEENAKIDSPATIQTKELIVKI